MIWIPVERGVGWEQKSGLGGGGGLGIKPKLPVCQAERGLGAPAS